MSERGRFLSCKDERIELIDDDAKPVCARSTSDYVRSPTAAWEQEVIEARSRAIAQDLGQGIGKGPWLGELDHVTVGRRITPSLEKWRR